MNYFQKLMSQSNDASWGRMGCFAIVTVWLIICVMTVILRHDHVAPDIPIQWAGLAAVLYGTAKIAENVGAAKTTTEEQKSE